MLYWLSPGRHARTGAPLQRAQRADRGEGEGGEVKNRKRVKGFLHFKADERNIENVRAYLFLGRICFLPGDASEDAQGGMHTIS